MSTVFDMISDFDKNIPVEGVNLYGRGAIFGFPSPIVKGENSTFEERRIHLADKYVATPTFEALVSGRRVHLGYGIWGQQCADCDTYYLSYGSSGWNFKFAEHMASHGGEVPGWNTALLS